MRTDAPMFTTETAAAEWHMPLPANHVILAGEKGWWAAHGEVCDAVFPDAMRGNDPDALGGTLADQVEGSVSDAANNAWVEGMSHDEWCSAVRRRLGL